MDLHKLFKREVEPLRVSAVVLAAGASVRFGSDKMMVSLGGIPVLVHTLRAMERCETVDEIIVVTRLSAVQEIADLCKEYGIEKVSKIVSGGATRMESALAGVSAVSRKARYIAIHDGARPFVSPELMERTAKAAREFYAAAPAMKSVDTLKAVDEKGFTAGTVDRENTMRVQTPQIFTGDLIRGALSDAVAKGLTLTDDSSAVERMGIHTCLVEGDERNIKITTPMDIALAGIILADWSKA